MGFLVKKKPGQVGIITPIVSLFSTKKKTSQRFKLGVKNINYFHYYHQSSFLRDTRNSYSNTRGYRPEKKTVYYFYLTGTEINELEKKRSRGEAKAAGEKYKQKCLYDTRHTDTEINRQVNYCIFLFLFLCQPLEQCISSSHILQCFLK